MSKKNIISSTISMGFLLYIQGFIFNSKTSAIVMLIGGLMLFIPLLVISISKLKKQKLTSIFLIMVSLYFIFLLFYITFKRLPVL